MSRLAATQEHANNPWDLAAARAVVRRDPHGAAETLEPGVNFFVLALEQMGAETDWSCEGHEGRFNNFYIAFRAPYPMAVRIASAGFFTVAISREGAWRLSFPDHVPTETLGEHQRRLRWAADTWVRVLNLDLPALLAAAPLASAPLPTAPAVLGPGEPGRRRPRL